MRDVLDCLRTRGASFEHEIGAVEGEEVEIPHALAFEVAHLLGHRRRGDELASLDIVLEAGEQIEHALGNLGAHLDAGIQRGGIGGDDNSGQQRHTGRC